MDGLLIGIAICAIAVIAAAVYFYVNRKKPEKTAAQEVEDNFRMNLVRPSRYIPVGVPYRSDTRAQQPRRESDSGDMLTNMIAGAAIYSVLSDSSHNHDHGIGDHSPSSDSFSGGGSSDYSSSSDSGGGFDGGGGGD